MRVTDPRLAMPVESAVLLWCMRVSMVEMQKPVDAEIRTHRVLEALGVAEAAPYVEGLMFAVGHGATRTVAVQCVCQPSISADEQALLDAVALAQESRLFEALLSLRGFLSPDGARAALHSAEKIGVMFARAGRFLDSPSSPLQQFGLTADSGVVRWTGV